MELEHDDIVVTYDASAISIDEILKACNDSGFPATVVTEPLVEPEKTAAEVVADEVPEFFLSALAKAKQENKPIVLDFSASWCAPCRQMIRHTFPDARVQRLLKRVVFLTIDADEDLALIKKYAVVGIPDIRFLSADGKEVGQLLGFRDAETFVAELQALLESTESADAETEGIAAVEE